MDKYKTVSFSGYRPEKLPDGGAESSNSIKALATELREVITESIGLVDKVGFPGD